MKPGRKRERATAAALDRDCMGVARPHAAWPADADDVRFDKPEIERLLTLAMGIGRQNKNRTCA
jgi:hypothetical protein